eukprot:scaffold10022_cov170-Amphora_coffeaeformis.AAC.10
MFEFCQAGGAQHRYHSSATIWVAFTFVCVFGIAALILAARRLLVAHHHALLAHQHARVSNTLVLLLFPDNIREPLLGF